MIITSSPPPPVTASNFTVDTQQEAFIVKEQAADQSQCSCGKFNPSFASG